MRPLDSKDKLVRFGCGGVFGAFIGLWLFDRWAGLELAGWVAGPAGLALAFGLLALWLGEGFWTRAGRLLSFFVGLRR